MIKLIEMFKTMQQEFCNRIYFYLQSNLNSMFYLKFFINTVKQK